MVTVDGDTSCSDTFLIFANGAAGGPTITEGSAEAVTLRDALTEAGRFLARSIARDGEGATHLITVEISGAVDTQQARDLGHTIALSSLVKTAVAGNDPNWGRILVAAGRSGALVDSAKASVTLQGVLLFDQGNVLPFDEYAVHELMKEDEVVIEVELRLGAGRATAWGCDLTTEYVHINADYRT
jgi:glutamate N-acetyltransferase/amino-acid N-acetyltransferase